MNVLMLSWRYIDHPAAGGAEVLTHEVLKRLVADGHAVTCFTASYPGASKTGSLEGVTIVRQGRQWTVHVRAWRWLRRRLDDFDVLIDQVNTIPFCTPWYIPAGKRTLFIHQLARGYWFRETRGLFKLVAPVGYMLEPHLLKIYRSSPAITVSASSKNDLVDLGFAAGRVAVIPEALQHRPVATLAPKEGALRVAMVGRLTPAKFVEEGVRAFEVVRREHPDATLDLVGSGDPAYKRKLERLIAKHGIGGVTFHGRVDDDRKLELLVKAHVHVITSHREGWGLVVSEAASMGTPSVGYDVQGVRDSIDDRSLLAPVGDADALAGRLISLVDDRQRYERVREEAWRRTQTMTYDATTRAFTEALGWTQQVLLSGTTANQPA